MDNKQKLIIQSRAVNPDPHGSAWIRIHILSWIRIRIQYADLDSGGENLREKTEKMKGKWKKIVIVIIKY